MKGLYFAAIFLILASSGAAEASSPLRWCDGCSDAQKNATAITSPLGKVYVGDVVNRTVYAYDVYMDVNDGYRPPRREKRADRIPVDATAQQDIQALINFYHWDTPGWAKTENVNYPDGSTNVYDVAFQGAEQNRFLSQIQLSSALRNQITALSVWSLSALFSIVPQQVIVVTFWDGSSIKILVDTSRNDIPLTVIDNSGKDSHNNTVLSTVTVSPITFNFAGGPYTNPTDRSRWAGHMGLLGYNTSGATSGATKVACTNSAAGLNCIIVRTNAN